MERRHAQQPALFRDRLHLLVAGLKIVAILDQLHSLRTHGRILFPAVAMWHHHHGRNPVTLRSKAHRLPVIAARGRYDSFDCGLRAHQVIEKGNSTANFEGPNVRMVLMLDPYLSPGAPRQ